MSRPSRRVTPAELRERFNDAGLFERASAGELLQIVEREGPAPDALQMPDGTVSRTVWYVDADLQKLALVHEYRLPDGTVGASGLPDPKRMVVDDEIWLA